MERDFSARGKQKIATVRRKGLGHLVSRSNLALRAKTVKCSLLKSVDSNLMKLRLMSQTAFRFIALTLATLAGALSAVAADKLELRKNDHVAIIGNTLADRMQHSGYFEALTYDKFPKHELVFRNLAFSADEVALRPRSENFGSPDDWLARAQADVVLAFFGFNESFKGAEGLEKFRDDLDKFIKTTLKAELLRQRARRDSCSSRPSQRRSIPTRITPIPAPINRQLEPYVKAMREVASGQQGAVRRFVRLVPEVVRVLETVAHHQRCSPER
jgi:hypothetical protein